MSSIIIGSARHAEGGGIYGEAGDQLQSGSGNDYSGEVSMQTFYVHSYGWRILRPKTAAVAEKMASGMKRACNNSNIGYSQSSDPKSGRYGVVNYGIDTDTPVGADCSSLVREDAKEATGHDVGDFTTESEKDVLPSKGDFEDLGKYVDQSTTPIYDGDALVTYSKKGHTVVVVDGSPRPDDTGSTGGTTGGTTGTTSSELDVDGEIGQLTTIRWQEAMGQTGKNVDGKIDGQPSSGQQYWKSILASVCSWVGGSSPLIKKWQSMLISAGYSCGSAGADGKLGVNTAKASQQYLKDLGFYTGKVDGYFWSESAKGLQRWLNSVA